MPLSAAPLFTNGHSTCFIWQSLVCFPRDLLLVRHSESTKFMFYSNLKMSRPLQESWPLDLFSLSLSVSLWKLLVQMKPVCHCYLNMKKENLNFEGHRDVVTGWNMGCTVERLSIYHGDNTERQPFTLTFTTMANLELLLTPSMSLDHGRKPEYSERSHTSKGGNIVLYCTPLLLYRFSLQSLSLWNLVQIWFNRTHKGFSFFSFSPTNLSNSVLMLLSKCSMLTSGCSSS